MMFTIRSHKDDKEVFELITVSAQTGKIGVWAIVLNDFIYDAGIEKPEKIVLALKAGKEFHCELSMKEA